MQSDVDQHRASRAQRFRSPAAHIADSVANALLHAAGRGDVQALGAFYDRTAPAIYRLLRDILKEQASAEQAVQQAYLQLWRSAPRFDPDLDSAWSLLLHAAHHAASHHMPASVAATTSPAASTHVPERD